MPIHPKGVTNKTNRKLTIKNTTSDIILLKYITSICYFIHKY